MNIKDVVVISVIESRTQLANLHRTILTIWAVENLGEGSDFRLMRPLFLRNSIVCLISLTVFPFLIDL